MQKTDGRLILSPSDLTRFLESEFVTWMDRFNLEFPGQVEPDPEGETDMILQRQGLDHERRFLDALINEGRDVVDVSSADDRFLATALAMQKGKEVIFQGALACEQFIGYADFLVRVCGDSNLGSWHYEPWDTKLALTTKPYFLIQLSCYADMLQLQQGVLPRRLHVVLGNGETEAFRTEDFLFYYRQLRNALMQQQRSWSCDNPPDFTGLEDYGRWSSYAQRLILESDDLCQVANIRAVQIRKLRGAGIQTMTALARSRRAGVAGMQQTTFHTLVHQARLQVESRDTAKPKYEVIRPQPEGRGLWSLPAVSPFDVYFDMEGYPLKPGGLEYLFGAVTVEAEHPSFHEWWALEEGEERLAFEGFVDWVYQRWKADGSMHVYHYGPYEKTAMRKLMGRYATREQEVDEFLRHGVFVDLYSIVRQSVRIGQPDYSIKSIERLYRGGREGDVSTALDSVVSFQRWLDSPDGPDWTASRLLSHIRAYNQDDCESTWRLRLWLNDLQESEGIAPPDAISIRVEERATARPRSAATELATRMLAGLPADRSRLTEEDRLTELLAHLLEFHWREAKPVFWAMFDRHDMSPDEQFEDPGCLAGLERTSTPPKQVKRSVSYEYAFDPLQDTKIDTGARCFYSHDLSETISVEVMDRHAGRILLKRATRLAEPPRSLSLILNEHVSAKKIADSIFRTVDGFLKGKDIPRALRDFLSRKPPRVSGWQGGALVGPGTDIAEAVTDLVSRLDNSTLCIQGPPGSGKTYTAARAIVGLLSRGMKVGVTSNSHKAIANLMDKVAQAANGVLTLSGAVKVQSNKDDFHITSPSILPCTPEELFSSSGSVRLVGGTAWTFSHEQAVGLVDYLFVDEAGQVSLANLVGMGPSARNLVLVGDQMQLGQPLQGTHPGESGLSVLDYLLQQHQVIPDDFGVFLSTTWRMHPDVCRFISGAVYEDRLQPHEVTAGRMLTLRSSRSGEFLRPSGVVFVPVEHEGNSQDSEEEANVIVSLTDELLRCDFTDGARSRSLSLADILFVAPYNMQVRRIKSMIPGANVGSVDKFQGQEAPVVIVSMCSSTGDASGRGLDFILSKNRLNVAISRAQTLAIVVGSPALVRTKCSRIEQIELINLFCRIVESSSAVGRSASVL